MSPLFAPRLRSAAPTTFPVLPALLALLLAACGGGGGGGGAPASAGNQAPIANFSVTPGSGTGAAPFTADFDGSASSDSDGSIATYHWNFGDGNTATGSSTQHIYSIAGTYAVVLTVTDDDGATDTAVAGIVVTGSGGNIAPVAVINSSRREGVLKDGTFAVTFDGTASTDSDGNIAGYQWDFGNGDLADIAAPTAVYDAAGVYNVTLTVTDNGGASHMQTVQVYVAAPTDTFNLSATAHIPGTLFSDCDTADTVLHDISVTDCNNTLAGAQHLRAPSIAGGYASASGAMIDAVDKYSVTLAGGETITLTVADYAGGVDLDLVVYDATDSGTPVATATEAALESVTVASAGDYVIRVQAASGGSNYLLNIGMPPASTGMNGAAPIFTTAPVATTVTDDRSEQFTDGEYIVRFAQLRTPWRADAQNQARSAELNLEVAAGNDDQPMLLRERRPASAHHVRRGLDDTMRQRLRELRARADVVWVEPNRVRQPQALDATDSYYHHQWNLPLARFPGAWQADSLHGSGAIVAVIDSGILADHPDFAGGTQLLPGYDFIADPQNAGDGDGIDSDPADPGLGVGRSLFHGTHVAGTIVAKAEFSVVAGNTGMAGAAPGAQVMPLRAFGRYGGTSFDIAQAIRYAAKLANASTTLPDTAADVLNLSFGSTGWSQVEQDAVTAARAQGLIIVAAAGNSNSNTVIYPAGYDGVVGVGAVAQNSLRAPYSNYGSHVDLVAPGGDTTADLDGNGVPDGILGTVADDSAGMIGIVYGYDFYQGTSMATPHIAAVAAMMKALTKVTPPLLSPAGFDALLASGALSRDLGDAGRDDDYGYGLIDAEKALVATGLVSASPALPVATPTRLNIGPVSTQAQLLIDNAGGGTLNITGFSDDAAWLTVNESTPIDATSKLGTYQVSVDDTALADGVYNATITFTSNSGPLLVPVALTVDSSMPANVDVPLYLILWDPQEAPAGAPVFGATPEMAAAFAGNGVAVPFVLGPVLADAFGNGGGYQVYIGTDMDNDGMVCDPGEACGAWESLAQPRVFVHAQARSVDFTVGWTSALGTLSSAPATIPNGIPAAGFPRR